MALDNLLLFLVGCFEAPLFVNETLATFPVPQDVTRFAGFLFLVGGAKGASENDWAGFEDGSRNEDLTFSVEGSLNFKLFCVLPKIDNSTTKN